MAYYLKYRPQSINDLDLASAREDLIALVSSESLPHSFLFAGPKGTGKTSAARILAKVINCENRKNGSPESCNVCEQCVAISKGNSIDVIEMDAASHRGIDDVRALRDAVKLSPASASKKVYIIDEAHMLTTEASNALLKTLEEPPSHVVFILATTNPEKLLPTIRSRTTHIRFKKATLGEMVASLEKKVKGEKIKVEKGVLEMIAREADGSFRDADKILEQLVSKGSSLTKELVGEILTRSESFDPHKLLNLMANRTTKDCLVLVRESSEQGVSVETMIDGCVGALRETMLAHIGVTDSANTLTFDNSEIIELIRLFIRARSELADVLVDMIPLELVIVEWCDSESSQVTGSGSKSQITSKTTVAGKTGMTNGSAAKAITASLVANDDEKVLKKPKKEESVQSHADSGAAITNQAIETKTDHGTGKSLLDGEIWTRVLSQVRVINASTEALLRASMPIELVGNRLKLGVYYSFHKEHLESYAHKSILEKVCAEEMGATILVECLLTNPPTQISTAHLASVEPQDGASQPRVTGATPADSVVPEEDSSLTEDPDEDIIRMAKEIFGE